METKKKNRKATIARYYDVQEVQDSLYQASLEGQLFGDLMSLITAPENIRLAYRTIKSNKGSQTAGTDKKTIDDYSKMESGEFVKLIQQKFENYHPRRVRRKDIPKPNGKTRPLGIPCMEDRIVQQCILQILEPVCEAKFYNRSYGFRPLRSAENAIAECYRLMQLTHCTFVVDVDIKGFFDNVNHRKLMRQLWTLGIRDSKLLQIIKQMLKAPILMPNGETVYPTKGTPQGGILSPLLANVVLNELDWWIASQWEGQCDKIHSPPKAQYKENGKKNYGNEYRILRKSKLKEMYIVRYADDFKIFCKARSDAVKIKFAVEQWLAERLKLQTSKGKSGITNLKKHYSELLGFKFKLHKKGNKQVVEAHMCDKAVNRVKGRLKKQIKRIQRPKDNDKQHLSINTYNSMVVGMQNYYQIATHVSLDMGAIQFEVGKLIYNRLDAKKRYEDESSDFKQSYLRKRYGKSQQVRWINGQELVPIGYCQCKNPMSKKASTNQYTKEGRAAVDRPPGYDVRTMQYLMRHSIRGESVEYNDNRVSLYAGQLGKCAITGEPLVIGDIHCHHKKPRKLGGGDEYSNLILVSESVHKLIHATKPDTILKYLRELELDEQRLEKLNKLRTIAELGTI